MNASQLRILMYHRFPEGRAFEEALSRQFAYIRRHYRPVSLGQVAQSWRTGEALPKRALAITVDDGYADFCRAWTLLEAFQLPATLFVVSGFLNREVWLWPDVVHYCFSMCPLHRISLELPDGTAFERTLKNALERQAADRDLDALLLAMPDESRRSVIAMLPKAASVSIPQNVPAQYAPLHWGDLGRMMEHGLEVGAHTETHPVLSRIASPERLQYEVEGSRSAIEKNLNAPVQHFCYPNGQASDLNAATISAVREAGYQSASTAQRGLNSAGVGHWELKRIGVHPAMAAEDFALELAGFRMK